MQPAGPGDGSAGEALRAREVVGTVRKDRLRAALFDEPPQERRIGRYRVVGLLGRGGMGTVLEVVDDALERRVALKLLHHDVPERDQGRLLREARALARLSHPNVVQVHEVGEHPRPFIAMELVRGRTLAEWQRERPPWRACVRAYLQAGRGLAAVHAQRLVHRDFKPSNCMIDAGGRVRVMDFGLARALGPGVEPSDDGSTRSSSAELDGSGSDTPLTDTGAVIGTLAYMPLEQLQGKEVDARSDQFGFCVALYEALHGERPFAGSTAAALERAMQREQVKPPPRDSRVPLALRRVLLRGLAADPERRWPTMDELLAALEQLVRPRWRSRVALVTVLAGVGLAGASVWHELAMRRACTGVEDQLAGAWDQARRDALAQALLGSPLPYARAAWEGVEPRLHAYAEAWVAASRDVCEEARVRQGQPESVVALRTACLHERKVALREAVDVLASADPAAVERAVGLVSQLPGLERCADVPALLAAVPPPEEPESLARVQALRDELIEARALRFAARYADSLAVVERVAQQAELVEYPPLEAEVQLGRGWGSYGEGRLDAAVAAFEGAYASAAAQGHDAVAAEAAAMLVFIVGERQAKHEVGLKWAVTARAHASRPAAEPGVEALALSNEAAIYNKRGDFALARESYERALAQQVAAFGGDDVRLAFTLNGLGVVYTALGDVEQAEAAHQRALVLRRDNLGPDHPHVAMSLNNLGVVAERQGHTERARQHMHEALAIKERILGPDHPELATSLANVGTLAHRDRRHDEARVLLERAVAIIERAEGPHASSLCNPLQNLGVVLRTQGRDAEAEAALRRALALAEHAHGPQHPELLPPLLNLADIAKDRGDYATAKLHVDRALELAERTLPADRRERGDALFVKGLIALEQGHASEAAALVEPGLQRLEQAGLAAHVVGALRLSWSRELAKARPPRLADALRHAEQVRAALVPHAGPEATRLRGEVDEWLAELKRLDPPR